MNAESLKRLNAKMAFDGKARARIYRKLAKFLTNGMSLGDALSEMHNVAIDDGKNPKDPIGYILKEWSRKISNGESLGRAISGWVPGGDRIVIEAGETAGKLPKALLDALYIQSSGKKIKREIQSGVAYPVFLSLLAIGLLVIFGKWIVPAFADIMPRENWTGTAGFMAGVADFVDTGLIPTILAVISIICVMMYSLPRWTGATRVKFDNYPPWSLYRLNAGSGFMLSLSALLRAGVKIPDILRILLRGATPWYHERISTTLSYVQNGANIGEALYKTKKNFPDKETVQDLRSYAKYSGFDDVLEELGREWIDDSVEKVKMQMAVLKNISLVLMGIVFGVIATGIFALQQQVSVVVNTAS